MTHYIFANDYYFIANTEVKPRVGIQVFTTETDWVRAIEERLNFKFETVADCVETAIYITEIPEGFKATIDNGQWTENVESSKEHTPTIEDFILNFSL